MRVSSDGWSVTVRGLVRPGCLLTARRYGISAVGIQGISRTVFGTTQYCMDSVRSQMRNEAAMERAYNLTARQWEVWMGEAYRSL